MPRPLRIERPDGWYHVTSRGNEQRSIFRDERDHLHFLELLPPWLEQFRVRLHAYVLMGNHYHLLVETPEANLSRAMQWLNLSYSMWFNRRHQRAGHLLQGRFHAVSVQPESWALTLSQYIHLNPVRVERLGLSKSQRGPHHLGVAPKPAPELVAQRLRTLREFRWSSYRAYAGYITPPAWLQTATVLDYGGGRPAERVKRYRESVEAEARSGLTASPWENLVGRLALGTREFVRNLVNQLGPTPAESQWAASIRERPAWTQVIAAVEKVKGAPWCEFHDQRGDWGRDLALTLGRHEAGMTLAELATATGASSSSAICMALKRFAKRAQADEPVREMLTEARRQL